MDKMETIEKIAKAHTSVSEDITDTLDPRGWFAIYGIDLDGLEEALHEPARIVMSTALLSQSTHQSYAAALIIGIQTGIRYAEMFGLPEEN